MLCKAWRTQQGGSLVCGLSASRAEAGRRGGETRL